MATLEDLKERLAAAKRDHHAGKKVEPGIIKALANEINRQLTEGANSCPSCGARPTAIEQPSGVEVGCVSCFDHHAKAASAPVAVAAWNRGIKFFNTPDRYSHALYSDTEKGLDGKPLVVGHHVAWIPPRG